MSSSKTVNKPTALLVEDDVVVRLLLADYLRSCAYTVIEAVDAHEAKAVLQAGPPVEVVLADAELAGEESGFALAQWIRRYRPHVGVLLLSSVASKAQAAHALCERKTGEAPGDPAALEARIKAMMAARRRRARPSTSMAKLPRRREAN